MIVDVFALALALWCCLSCGVFSLFTNTFFSIEYLNGSWGRFFFCPNLVEAFYSSCVLAAATCLGGCAQEAFFQVLSGFVFDWFRGCWPMAPIVASMLLGNAWTRAPGQHFRLDLGSSSFRRAGPRLRLACFGMPPLGRDSQV